MEKMLQKIAQMLETLDEASLMALWGKYATLTSRFEPTKRWEEACLIFSLIQAKHWKNQLFNYSWSQSRLPPAKDSKPVPQGFPKKFELEKKTEKPQKKRRPCKILPFSLAKNLQGAQHNTSEKDKK